MAPSDAQEALEAQQRARGLSDYVESTKHQRGSLVRRDSTYTDVSSDGSEAYDYYQDCYDPETDFQDAVGDASGGADGGATGVGAPSVSDLATLQSLVDGVATRMCASPTAVSEADREHLHTLMATAAHVNPVVLQQFMAAQAGSVDPAVLQFLTQHYHTYMEDNVAVARAQAHRYYDVSPMGVPVYRDGDVHVAPAAARGPVHSAPAAGAAAPGAVPAPRPNRPPLRPGGRAVSGPATHSRDSDGDSDDELENSQPAVASNRHRRSLSHQSAEAAVADVMAGVGVGVGAAGGSVPPAPKTASAAPSADGAAPFGGVAWRQPAPEDPGESSWTEVDGDVFHDAAEG